MSSTKRYALACDLKDDPKLIAEYEEWHKPESAWPEITESISAGGIKLMEIYRIGNRLFMIIEVDDDFSFEQKAEMDANNPKVQEWEALMDRFQERLPWGNGEKWVLMKRIFETQRK